MDAFYQMPLRFRQLVGGNPLPKCDIKTSIYQNLKLILSTRLGEYKFDPNFGNPLWDVEFELDYINDDLKNKLQEIIKKYERRLEAIQVDMKVTKRELIQKLINPTKNYTYAKKVELSISGDLKKGKKERTIFSFTFLIGPQSLIL